MFSVLTTPAGLRLALPLPPRRSCPWTAFALTVFAFITASKGAGVTEAWRQCSIILVSNSQGRRFGLSQPSRRWKWRTTRNAPRFGFTLLELLVVIAIIALLSSLVLPALSCATQSARSTVCLNNLRQFGLASSLYASDAGRFPSILEWLYGRDDSRVASGQLYPYLSSSQVYLCPSDARLKPVDARPLPDHSYSMNCMMCHAHDVSACVAPANILFFLEQTNVAARLNGGLANAESPRGRQPAFNHIRRAHLLMVDTHVQTPNERQYLQVGASDDFWFPNDGRSRRGNP